MIKLRRTSDWRATVQKVADQLLTEHGVEAFWMAERFRRRGGLTDKEQRLSDDVFAEVERRTRATRSTARSSPRAYGGSYAAR